MHVRSITHKSSIFLPAAESGNTTILTSPTSVPSLLVSVLRAATPIIDLPFQSRYVDRTFPLGDTPETASDHSTHPASADVKESEHAELEHLNRLCPELRVRVEEREQGEESGEGSDGRSIEIRHVQRMAPGGKHFVCLPKCPGEVEPMLRKSSNVTR